MNQVTKQKQEKWIVEGGRLRKLREERQMSREELARKMRTSKSRIARLENGESVRDAHTLVHFYELIIKYQELVEIIEVRNKKIRHESQYSETKSSNMVSLKDSDRLQKLKNTRLCDQKITYI